MGSSSTDADYRAQIRRQEVVTDLGQQALETGDLEGLLGDAATAVAETLDVECCTVFERRGDGAGAVLRGIGGGSTGRVGSATVAADRPSLAGAALRAEEPVVDDFREESSVSVPEPLADRDVDSAAAVRIGPLGEPWGVLSAYATDGRPFDDADVDFLERVADVLASAIENVRTRRDLERTERRFEAIFEDPNVLVGLLEPDGTVADINGTAMEYVDADPADVTGEPFWETPWWGRGDGIRDDVREWTERAAGGEYVNFETDLTRPDGERYTLEGAFRPVTDDEGEVVSVIVSDRDVTEREEGGRQFSALMDNVPSMVYRCENERGWPMEFVSDACEELTGYDPDALERGDVSWGDDVMVQADRRKLWETVQRETEEGTTFSVTYRIETADGERRWVRDDGRGVFDERGDFVRIEGIISDVTERKRTERRLEEERDMFAGGPAVVFRWRNEPGWPVEYVSANVDDVLGYSPVELESGAVPYTDLLVEEDLERVTREVEAHSDGTTERFSHEPYRVRTSDGDVRWVKDTTTIVRDDDGEITRYLGYLVDITERKERERELRERERRLEESERRYRTLAQHFPNGAVGVYDRDLTYTLAEGGELGETLPPADRLEGDRMPDIFPEHTVADLEPLFRAAVEDGETGSTETTFGGRHWRVWATPLRDADGEVFAGLSFAQDVTEQVEREKHLERYETIVEAVNDGVYVVDEDGEFTMVNETYAEMIGYEPADLAGEHVSTVVDDHVSEQIPALMEEQTDRPTLEANVRTVDGDAFPAEATFAMLPEDDSEWHRVGVVRDIRERKERERQLEESERRYRTLVENFPDGAVGLYDEDLEYIVVGGEAFDDLGVSEDEVAGATLYDRYSDDLVAEIEPYFRAVFDGESNTFEYRAHGRDVWAHTLPVRNEGDEIFAGMVMVQDVTERREYERRLEESNERLEQFAYAASHDLQEPLRMVTSYLQLLENRYGDAFDADGEEFLEFAVDGAERMREMIDGLLEYSRVETRGDPFEPMDPNGVLEDALADLQFRIEETDAGISVEDLPRVEGDASQVRQVFQNLLSNALTYSGDESPTIRVGAERRSEEVVLSVEDEGVGIDPADQDRVFTIFDRLHSREEYDGTGIGLALCERIVERHGGEIWLESEPGEGSTFFVTLPAPQAE